MTKAADFGIVVYDNPGRPEKPRPEVHIPRDLKEVRILVSADQTVLVIDKLFGPASYWDIRLRADYDEYCWIVEQLDEDGWHEAAKISAIPPMSVAGELVDQQELTGEPRKLTPDQLNPEDRERMLTEAVRAWTTAAEYRAALQYIAGVCDPNVEELQKLARKALGWDRR